MPENKEENIQQKKYADCITETKVDEDERTVKAIISTITVDREKEVLLPKGVDFEQYLKNPVVLWAHDYHGTPIARALWLQKNRKSIEAKIQFAKTEKAEDIYQLFKGGYLKAFSVGFLPAEDGSHPPTPDEVKKHPEWAEAKRIYDKWELLEFSAVPVPANPEALAIAVKSKGIELSQETQEELGIDDEITVWAGTEIEKNIEDEAILKPFENEHSCRLKPPNYPEYSRVNCDQKHDGKCIDVIYGIKSPNKSEIQALRFDKKIWTASAAKSVCSNRGGTFEAAKSITRKHPKLKKTIRGKLYKHIDPKECTEYLVKILKGRLS